ncbi:hypothetical protein [Fructobacillus tropaeoli]|uniref:hypothetical protein n=1 Tax=Fructobacillus tropaeoli TaxID=709323 RepID=UPI002DA419AE|nr:unnamed protein product [Fructobacillus tropaeoli]
MTHTSDFVKHTQTGTGGTVSIGWKAPGLLSPSVPSDEPDDADWFIQPAVLFSTPQTFLA